MRASVHVDLPAFKTKQDVKDWVKSKGLMIDIRGTRGEATSTEGVTRYDVSNKARLGSTCVEQITCMVDGVAQLLQA
jgi:protein-arginine kinase